MSEITRVECATCGWWQESRDGPWTRHAGVVHVEILKPGHVLNADVFGNVTPSFGHSLGSNNTP